MPTIPYTLKNGTRVPGVTTVIGASLGWNKGALMHWAWSQGKEGLDYRETQTTAADAGTLAHAMVEAAIHRLPFTPPLTASAQQMHLATLSFSAFEEWLQGSRIELVETEIHLVSQQHRFGGTPDAVGRMKGQLCLLDWKTSKAVYAEYLIQLSAYVRLWNENRDDPIVGGIHCCRFDKETGGFSHHYWPVEALDPAWEAFLRLRDLYDLQKSMKNLAA